MGTKETEIFYLPDEESSRNFVFQIIRKIDDLFESPLSKLKPRQDRKELLILLDGPLGVGKTYTLQGLCRWLGFEEATSPSFSLNNIYKRRASVVGSKPNLISGSDLASGSNTTSKTGHDTQDTIDASDTPVARDLVQSISHWDLYRMESEEELESSGFFDDLRGTSADSVGRRILVVEWASKLTGWDLLWSGPILQIDLQWQEPLDKSGFPRVRIASVKAHFA